MPRREVSMVSRLFQNKFSSNKHLITFNSVLPALQYELEHTDRCIFRDDN
jgi:hypothetical protein